MSIKLQLPKLTELKPRITVIGVGGAGGNALNNMIACGLSGVEFVATNTDAQALALSSAEHRIQLGVNLTEGLGAGSRPEIGEAAAEEAIDELRAQISGSHMCFIAAGMGGGTGTGAAAVVARAAKELGVLTVGVVTKPFQFEGARRMRVAEAGIAELKKYVDTLIVIPNQNLFRIANEKTTFAEAFVLADRVLHSGIACIVDLIVREGLINLDFADVRTVMKDMGSAMMGTGGGTGERRALEAAEAAIHNPLLDEVSLRGAKGLLLSITGSRDLTLYEVDEAASRVRQEVDPEANIIVGATFDDTLDNSVRVSIVAAGFERPAGAMRHDEPGAGIRSAQQSHEPSVRARQASGERRGREFSAGDMLRVPPRQEGRHEEEPLDLQSSHELPALRGPARDPSRDPWRAHSDVTVVEQPPHFLQAGGLQGAEPVRANPIRAGSEPSGFRPAPPADVRPSLRRMPEVEDFPLVGQREFHAKVTSAGPLHSGPANSAASSENGRRRLGFFERWSGRGRRAEAESLGLGGAQHAASEASNSGREARHTAPGQLQPADHRQPHGGAAATRATPPQPPWPGLRTKEEDTDSAEIIGRRENR